MTAAGWYYAQGDPAGTTRYWDGTQWIGDPVPTPPTGPMGPAGAPASALNLASPGARIGGRLIDVIIISIIAIAVFVPVIQDLVRDIDALGPTPSDADVERIVTDALEDNIARLGIVGLVGLLWDFLWVAFVGGTPGKLILGLRVAAANTAKTPPGIGKAALRSLNRLVTLVPIIGGLVGLLVGLASLVMLFSDDQHRTVMDRIASTVVIKK